MARTLAFRFSRWSLRPQDTRQPFRRIARAALQRFLQTEAGFRAYVTLSPWQQRQVCRAMATALHTTLMPEDFYRMLATTLLDESGVLDVRSPLYGWAKRHLFGGSGRVMFAELAKYREAPTGPTLDHAPPAPAATPKPRRGRPKKYAMVED